MNNLPKRKSPRLNKFDYSTPGAYFITICTHNKTHMLSHITVGAVHEPPVNDHESPANVLTEYGIIADGIINTLDERFNVCIDKYVITPNHIHMLIILKCDERVIRELPLQQHRHLIDKIVGYMKMNISKKIHLKHPGIKIWQRSYHDHIIRNKNDYEKIWKYIDTNVLKWKNDCFNK